MANFGPGLCWGSFHYKCSILCSKTPILSMRAGSFCLRGHVVKDLASRFVRGFQYSLNWSPLDPKALNPKPPKP